MVIIINGGGSRGYLDAPLRQRQGKIIEKSEADYTVIAELNDYFLEKLILISEMAYNFVMKYTMTP